MTSRLRSVFLFLFVCSCSASAQTLTAVQIMDNVRKQFETVHDYTATLTATIDMERLKIPEMKVKLFFKQPDKIHVESSNFAMLPKEGIALNPGRLLERFEPTLLGKEDSAGTTTYRLRLDSKGEKGLAPIQMLVWVDAKEWVITRVESGPDTMRKVTVVFDHTLVDGKYLMVSKISLNFDSQQPADTTATDHPMSRRMPRKGSATITYSDYVINSGLSDEIFEEKPKE